MLDQIRTSMASTMPNLIKEFVLMMWMIKNATVGSFKTPSIYWSAQIVQPLAYYKTCQIQVKITWHLALWRREVINITSGLEKVKCFTQKIIIALDKMKLPDTPTSRHRVYFMLRISTTDLATVTGVERSLRLRCGLQPTATDNLFILYFTDRVCRRRI